MVVRQGDRRPLSAPTALGHQVAFPCLSTALGHLEPRLETPQARHSVSGF